MDFSHSELHLKAGDIIKVHCGHPFIILVMNEEDFHVYQRGQKNNYYNGGYFEVLLARIIAPSEGLWHLIIDVGYATPIVMHSIRTYTVT